MNTSMFKNSRLAGPLSKKIKFTRPEDMKLIELVEKYSTKNWNKIAQHLPPRTARQCRDRWFNYLDPDLSTEPWTPAEDQILLNIQEKIGNHWKRMKDFLPNRSKNSIKQRWEFLKSSNDVKPKQIEKQTEKQTETKVQQIDTNSAIVLTPSNLLFTSYNLGQISNNENNNNIIQVLQLAAILPLTPVYITINTPTFNLQPEYQSNINENNQLNNINENQYDNQNDINSIMYDNFY